MASKEQENWLKYMAKLRDEFGDEARKVFPNGFPTLISCYKCAKVSSIGDTISYHWTGFTYHEACLPEN